MRFSRFYQSCMPPTSSSTSSTELQISVGTGPQPRASDLSGHRQTSTASSRSQWALPGLNRELQSSQRALTSIASARHSQMSTASVWCQSAMADLNGQRQMSDRMPQRPPDRMSEYICQMECQNICQIECPIIIVPEYVSDRILVGGRSLEQSNF